jgi:hypothetical protein
MSKNGSTVLAKKTVQFKKCSLFKTLFLKNLSSKFKKIGQVWKELEKMNKLGPLSVSLLKPFRNGEQKKKRFWGLHNLFGRDVV